MNVDSHVNDILPIDSHYTTAANRATAHQSSTSNRVEAVAINSNVTATANSQRDHHKSFPDIRVDSTRVRSAKCKWVSFLFLA